MVVPKCLVCEQYRHLCVMSNVRLSSNLETSHTGNQMEFESRMIAAGHCILTLYLILNYITETVLDE